ncbi:hypothetical protein D3C80_2186490 [compost metagenome]
MFGLTDKVCINTVRKGDCTWFKKASSFCSLMKLLVSLRVYSSGLNCCSINWVVMLWTNLSAIE